MASLGTPTNERDTHFQGFAKLLYEDFLQLAREDTSNIADLGTPDYEEKWRMKVEHLIAQRAYDLVQSVVDTVPITEWEFDMRDIPDLARWPDLKESGVHHS